MFETLLDVLAATLALAGELAAAAPWAVPLLPALWAGLAWASVRKGRELGGFLTLLAGFFLFFGVWAATSGNAGLNRWQRRELSIDYLYIAMFVVIFLFIPSLLINLAAHYSLRARRGHGLGHSEMRPDTGRPVVLTTKPAEDEDSFPVPVEEQRAALARAADLREGGEEREAEAASGQPGALLVADLARACQAGGPEVGARCVEAFGELLAGAAAAHGGRLLQSVDTALVYHFFSSRQALACALDLADRVGEYNQGHRGAALQVRTGVHTGLVLQSEGKVKGRDAALAAALMVTAPPGGIQVSGATRDVLPKSDQDRFEHLDVKKLRGVPEPLDIWRLKPADPETET
ncbi:MAG: adenylate/guanylate cyclase domain-containing protein [Thermodesulfobacteriota bacterium]